jgi:hypothetical protein
MGRSPVNYFANFSMGEHQLNTVALKFSFSVSVFLATKLPKSPNSENPYKILDKSPLLINALYI